MCFPHICAGCGTDNLPRQSSLCLRCITALPDTNFEYHPGNPVEKLFWGRIPLAAATAQFYFAKETLVQRLVHRFKYKGELELGRQLGRLMGDRIKQSGRFDADALVPLPLFPAKEKKRGYNQSLILCRGMSESMRVPVLDKIITRPRPTGTQTRKGRIERWENMEGKFLLREPAIISGRHILLVDDVVTTGATLEACGSELLRAGNVKLSLATLCVSSR